MAQSAFHDMGMEAGAIATVLSRVGASAMIH